MATGELRVSYLGGPGSWIGAIRRGRQVVWSCPHSHGNRDQSTSVNSSAHECANYVHEALTQPEKAADVLAALRKWHPSHVGNVDVSRQHLRAIALREWAQEMANTLRAAGVQS